MKPKKKRFSAGNRLFSSLNEAKKTLRPMMGPNECIPIYRTTPKGYKVVCCNLCTNELNLAYISIPVL